MEFDFSKEKTNHQFLKIFARRFIFIDFKLKYPLIINSILKNKNSKKKKTNIIIYFERNK